MRAETIKVQTIKPEMITAKTIIAGIDEAGRGPLAGPVTAGCVVLPPGYVNFRVRDSKTIAEIEREELAREIRSKAVAFAVVAVGARRIEQLNIRAATQLAMALAGRKVLNILQNCPDLAGRDLRFLIDGNMPVPGLFGLSGLSGLSGEGVVGGEGSLKAESCVEQESIVKGDSKVAEISAASILAKVYRDELMGRLDRKFPQYLFAAHKGYPTAAHREIVSRLGPSPVHRRTFRGVREYL
ncbi:MAG: ribonuclease HII [bacterium]|nr:ribonuclease HII [bacterium]